MLFKKPWFWGLLICGLAACVGLMGKDRAERTPSFSEIKRDPPLVARRVEGPDDKLFAQVMVRLLGTDIARNEYPVKYAYPPNYSIMPNSQQIVNAFATASPVLGATIDPSGRTKPIVMVTEGMLKEIIKGDENSLAVIMGHELAHLAKDHVGSQKGDIPLVALAFGRDQEIEADLNGLRYALAAGYPYRAGVASAIGAMRKQEKATSFEGLSLTHPTWTDRLALLDREQAKLWASMSAFQNGFLFLHLEQYPAAQQCFKAVLAEFPDCYEAWANLGYAQLMQYCDGLDSDDVRQYGVGPIAAGAFYARPESLESKVRGVDEKLWQNAVKALNKALELKSDLALPHANLGIAYLFHPEGKQVKKAAQFFKDAKERLEKDPEVTRNPLSMAALSVNSAVADLARGAADEAKDKLAAADRLLDKAQGRLVSSVDAAFLYNQALVEARSPDKGGKEKACNLLEAYLFQTSPTSAWWPLAFSQYAKICKEAGRPAKGKDDVGRRVGVGLARMLVSVNVGPDLITLSEPAPTAVARLGDGVVTQPLFPGSKIARHRSAARGIDILAKDRVLAIFLTNAQAPPIEVRGDGVSAKGRELRVGMAEKDAREVLKGQFVEKGARPIAEAGITFEFYPGIGLAVRFKDDKVEELAIAQLPRGPMVLN